MLDHASEVSFLGAIILFLRYDRHLADPFGVKGIDKRFSSKDISKRNPLSVILIHDTLEDTEVKDGANGARHDMFEGHGILWLECNVSADLICFLLGKGIQLGKRAANVVGVVGVDQLALLVADDDRGLLGGVAHAQRIARKRAL